MSDTKFTPGPWMIATSCSYRRIVSRSGEGVCEPITQCSDGHPDLHFRNGGFTGPDAHLIAAAPDLYEALEACNPVPGSTADKLRTLALAKARGEED
jgi:hypothetical protein